MKAGKLTKVLAGLMLALTVAAAPATALASTSATRPCEPDDYQVEDTVVLHDGNDGRAPTPGYKFIATNLGGQYYIFSELGYALDMDCAHKGNQGNAQIWPYNGTDAQKWILQSDGCGFYKIMNVNSGRVLSIANNCNDAGTQVWQYDDWDSYYQKWVAYRVADYDGHVSYEFLNAATGQALDVKGGVARRGTRIQQWPSNNTRAQRWILQSAN